MEHIQKGDIVQTPTGLGVYVSDVIDEHSMVFVISRCDRLLFNDKHITRIGRLPELPEGVKVGDWAEFSDYEDFLSKAEGALCGLSTEGCYVDSSDSVWEHCRPIQRKKRVKKASEIAKWFEQRGVVVDSDGTWCDCITRERLCPILFTAEMFSYCGKEPSELFDWHPGWLEEIEA